MTQSQGREPPGRRDAQPGAARDGDSRPCTIHSPRRRSAGIDLGQRAAALALLAWSSLAAAREPVIRVENDARVPAAQLESILQDCRAWAVRVYRYHEVEDPAPVTLKLTHRVPFGFYRDGTVLMPPSADRWELLDNWVHELTHHATGHDSSFFFKEGIAVHTLEKLFGEEGRVPDTWPQFGQRTDAWVRLYVARGQRMPLSDALAWPRYRGDTPEQDFRSWQIYNLAGSFVGWYLKRHGRDAFRHAFAREWPAQESTALERDWLAAIAGPPEFDAGEVLPDRPRYREYAQRLAPAKNPRSAPRS